MPNECSWVAPTICPKCGGVMRETISYSGYGVIEYSDEIPWKEGVCQKCGWVVFGPPAVGVTELSKGT